MRWIALVSCTVIGGAASADVPMFVDDTPAAGLSFEHTTNHSPLRPWHMMTPGMAADDIDGDGDIDLIVGGGLGQNAGLFVNDGMGVFEDRAVEWMLDLTATECSCLSLADVDRDGDLDLFAGAMDGPSLLLLNEGDRFAAPAQPTGIGPVDNGRTDVFGSAFGDVDLDGDLDLVVVDWRGPVSGGNRLYLNDGDGTFTEATGASGLFMEPVNGFAPALVDLDGDRIPELIIAADYLTSRYYAGHGDGTFTLITANGTGTDENGMGSAMADYDNDGDLDWFVTSIFDDDGVADGTWGVTGNRLYRNDGNHVFTDVTDEAGVRDGGWGWGTTFGDLDLDGRADLGMTNGYLTAFFFNPDPSFETDPSRLWINGGGAPVTCAESADAAGVTHTAAGKCMLSFDADNDGDLDLAISTNHGPLSFYRNQLEPSGDRWIALQFDPPPACAPHGFGATIDISVAGSVQHQAIFGAPSFMGHEPLRAHFGFAGSAVIDALTVRWPDGTNTVWAGVATGQVLTLRRGDVDASGIIDSDDLVAVILAWGPCAGVCAADVDGSGVVDVDDLLVVLLGWG